MATTVRVVIFSRQSALQQLLGATLGADISVQVESDGRRILGLIAQGRADVVIVDLDSRFAALETQLAFIAKLKGIDLPVLVLTDDDRRSTALELLEHGVYAHFLKPPSPVEMTVIIRHAHEHAQLKRELAETRKTLHDVTHCGRLIGQSSKMLALYDLIRCVADLDSGILVTGESGTGKELVAQAIHQLGGRAHQPFAAVSCGAIPETLIEAELFGHEKGTFTGAIGQRQGLLELAGAGTLFLDEIGELSVQTQVKLLRVLQQKEFTRLGGRHVIPLKARVLFATHRDLRQMVDEGGFRRDLFFRINVMELKVPPLRERTEDIPVLANHFLEIHSEACRKPILEIENQAMRALLSYDWPGNVRELENAIHRAIIVAQHENIGTADLPESFQKIRLESEDGPVRGSFEDLLRQLKRKIALQAILECNGNKTMAAMSLSISRAYLHRLIRTDATEAEIA